MILVISLILFMIFLIYSIRPINHEPYKIDEVKISWTNKSGIEGTVNKWILVLVNSNGVELHRLENTDVNNRKNFTNVTIPFIQNKDFDDKIFGENKLKVYWNTVNDNNNLLLTTNITFNRDDFSASISNLVMTDNNFIFEKKNGTSGTLTWSLYTGAYFPDIASFSNKTVQASGTTTSIPNISTGTGRVLKDTPETMRRASSIWSGEAIGVGHGRGRLDSEQGWSSQHNIVGQWYGIDNGVVGKITGIAIKARKYYNQWVKTFKVQYKGASGTWANVDGGKTYTGNTDKDTQVDVFFDTPVEASSIRIYPQTWNEHMSMRCDIFVGGVISGDIHSVSRSDYAVHWQGYFVPKITGDHTFWTESDDMSYLTIDGAIVVDNGGLHGMVEKNGKINLTKDKRYKLDIYFSEKGGGDEIIVRFFHTGMSEWTTDFNGYLR